MRVTGSSDSPPTPEQAELLVAQLEAYARDVRESFKREIARTHELEATYVATVRTLAAAVEAKDGYTGAHIRRVHDLALRLASLVVPDDVEDPHMSYGFLLHDIGKLAVPDAVLTKPGALTDEEWAIMRRHPDEGVRILGPIAFLESALDVVRYHHERWDGRGYPCGLAGEDIPLWARVFAIADTVDAMCSDRPYRRRLPLEKAFAEVQAQAGTQFDPGCARALLELDVDEVRRLLVAAVDAARGEEAS